MFYNDDSLSKYDDVLTITDLMDYLAVGKNTAYSLIREGKIKSFRIGHNYKIPKQAVIDYIHSVANQNHRHSRWFVIYRLKGYSTSYA